MRKALFASLGVLVIGLMWSIATRVEPDTAQPEPTEFAESDLDPPLDDATGTGAAGDGHGAPVSRPSSDISEPPVPDQARAATVRRLADGDSLLVEWVDTGQVDELRLNGINAPERDACFGEDAREVFRTLIDDDTLFVDGVERDEFGRVIADVWVRDRFVNSSLVELGAALALSGQGSHAALVSQAQQRARIAGAGLWNPEACGPDPATSITVTEIVYDAPGRDDQNPNGEWIEFANTGGTDLDLTDFSIRDESTRHRYTFPARFILAAGRRVRVLSGCGIDDATTVHWCAGDPVWNNSGDTGLLIGPDGRFVDVYSYNGAP